MKLAFESDLFEPSISKALSTFSDKSRVCLSDIHFDEANGEVEILFQRNEIIGYKKTFFKEILPIYSRTKISSLWRIRQVEGMSIDVDDRLVAECNSYFTVLFGVKMDPNEIYIESAEEVQGKTLCRIIIKVKSISIELNDL